MPLLPAVLGGPAADGDVRVLSVWQGAISVSYHFIPTLELGTHHIGRCDSPDLDQPFEGQAYFPSKALQSTGCQSRTLFFLTATWTHKRARATPTFARLIAIGSGQEPGLGIIVLVSRSSRNPSRHKNGPLGQSGRSGESRNEGCNDLVVNK